MTGSLAGRAAPLPTVVADRSYEESPIDKMNLSPKRERETDKMFTVRTAGRIGE